MPTCKTHPSLSARKFQRAALAGALAATCVSILSLPTRASAAPGGGQPSSVELGQRLAKLETIVEQQQALIASQAGQIKALQGQLQNVVTRDGAGNVVVPGDLRVGGTAVVGGDVQVARHLMVQLQMAVGGNLAVGRDVVVERHMLVKTDLSVQRNVNGGAAQFSSVKAKTGEFLELTAVNELRAVHGKFGWTPTGMWPR